jgi:hypothetical protein
MGDLMSLKIKDIIVHVIKSDLDIPFAFSQGWVKKRSATLVEIKTNDGLQVGEKLFVKAWNLQKFQLQLLKLP